MINKKKIWFLTLFSLILVLSLYYITMPKDTKLSDTKTGTVNAETGNKDSEVEESSALVALKVENEETILEELEMLKEVLINKESTVDEKNEAFEKIKQINLNKGEEEQIEKSLKTEFKCDFYVKVKDENIKVMSSCTDKSLENVNKIMLKVKENYTSKVYVTVEFK